MKKYLHCIETGAGFTEGRRYAAVEVEPGEFKTVDDNGVDRTYCEETSFFVRRFMIETEDDMQITVLADESLGGVEREYHEVKRVARVGERIKALEYGYSYGYDVGDVLTVTDSDRWNDGSGVSANPDNAALNHSEYVVLEPTDIIRIDGERFRMVDRKAVVGERVIVVNAKASNGTYHNGDVLTVVSVRERGGISIDRKGRDMVSSLLREEYHVLEPLESAKTAESAPLSEQPASDQVAANISALQAQVKAMESTLQRMGIDLRVAREDIVLIEKGVTDDIERLADRIKTLESAGICDPVASGPVDDAPPSFSAPAKTPQQLRDEVVERAKADVKRLTVGRDVDFVVNREKRAVVALICGTISGRILSRGIAKAAPNDVFNSHIGRAIALRRALGLDIPAEYLNVPNPEEPRVGDVVLCHGTNGDLKIIGTLTERATEFDGRHYGNNAFYWSYGGWIADKQYRIIDDSREEVGA